MSKPLNRLLDEGDRFEMYIEGMRLTLDSSLDMVINQKQLKVQTMLPSIPTTSLSNKTVELVSKKDVTGIVRVKGKITQLIFDGNCAEMTIEIADDVEQMQRRAFYRLPITKDVHVGMSEETDSASIQGITQNISAGGMRFLLTKSFDIGEVISVSLDLGGQTYQFKSRVLQSTPAENSLHKSFVRVEFLNISERDRSKLLAYIFNEQSKQNKRVKS